MTQSGSGNKKLAEIAEICRPVFWKPERMLGKKWVPPEYDDYRYLLGRFSFSLTPTKGLTVTKLELELELFGERGESGSYMRVSI